MTSQTALWRSRHGIRSRGAQILADGARTLNWHSRSGWLLPDLAIYGIASFAARGPAAMQRTRRLGGASRYGCINMADRPTVGEYATGYALATPRSSFAATEENARKHFTLDFTELLQRSSLLR